MTIERKVSIVEYIEDLVKSLLSSVLLTVFSFRLFVDRIRISLIFTTHNLLSVEERRGRKNADCVICHVCFRRCSFVCIWIIKNEISQNGDETSQKCCDGGFGSSKRSRNFKNVLLSYRNESDLYWATRPLKFFQVNSIRSAPSPTPKQLIAIVSKNVEKKLKQEGKWTKEVSSKIVQTLNEIGYDFNLPIIRWLALLLTNILKSTLTGLYVSNIGSALISGGSTPVVLLPTHRSYADFILLAYIAFLHDIELPCVAAGMDFHAMFLMGNVLRKCKAFYMKRRFSDDSLYKMIFNDYLSHLLILGNSPIEFFIEGTRSRSNKSLTPKYGLLSTIVDSFLKKEVVDVNIVPVSLVYEKIMEEKLFAFEHLGIPKPKESTLKLLQTLRNMNNNYGNVYVTFGEPISLRSCITRGSADSGKQNRDLKELTNLGVSVIKSHKELSVISVFSIVSVAVASLLTQKKSLGLDLVSSLALEIIEILNADGASIIIEGNLENALLDSIKLHDNLLFVDSQNRVLKFNDKLENVSLVASSSAQLSLNQMQGAIPLIMLQLYINPLMWHLARPAIMASILLAHRNKIEEGLLKAEFLFANKIFSKEFVNTETSEEKIFNQTLNLLNKIGLTKVNSSTITLNDEKTTALEILIHSLLPFSTGYLQAINILIELPKGNIYSNVDLLKLVQRNFARLNEQGKLDSLYALSLDLIGNALSSFIDLGVLVKDSNEKTKFRVGLNQAFMVANTLDSVKRGTLQFSEKPTIFCKL